jgi:hypothetical protein
MEDLSLENSPGHTRLLKKASRFRHGLAGLNGNPHTAVLDWSTCQLAGPELLAAFPVLAFGVMRDGADVICCEPAEGNVATALRALSLERITGARWVQLDRFRPDYTIRHNAVDRLPSVRAGRRGMTTRRRAAPAFFPISPPILVRPSDLGVVSETLGSACENVGDAARLCGAGPNPAACVAGLLRELASNALNHAEAQTLSVVSALVPSRRELQFAVADDGIGYGARIGRRFGTSLLDPIPERYFIAELLRGVFESNPGGFGLGRGLVFMIRELLTETDARLTIRSGGVLANLSREGLELTVLASRSNGFGTTILVRIPVL